MLWVKTFHIFFVMSWMAGIFYLPRIFVHCAEGKKKRENIARLIIMAHKLIYFILPLCLLSLATGAVLWLGYGIGGPWLEAKLLLVLVLLGHYGYSFRLLAEIKAKRVRSPLFYRVYNELPVFVLFGVVYLVIFKPVW